MSLNFKIIPVTNFEQNCTLVWCDETNEAAVIDPGGDLLVLEKTIHECSVQLKKILLTHAHIDHIGAAAKLAKKFNVEIEGPNQEDEFLIKMLPQQSRMFNFEEVEGFTPSRWLNHADVTNVGNIMLNILHCPGHTPGHVIFYNEEERWAQVGDVIFAGSIGRSDLPKGDHDTLIDSIKNRLFKLNENIQFIPGHGPMSTLGHEKKTNPYLQA